MKKNRNKIQPPKNKDIAARPEAVLPAWIFYSLFAAWAVFVFTNYSKHFTIAPLSSYFVNISTQNAGSMAAVLFGHLKNVLSALFIFTAGLGLGKIGSGLLKKTGFFGLKDERSGGGEDPTSGAALREVPGSAFTDLVLGMGMLSIMTFVFFLAGITNRTFITALMLALSIYGIYGIKGYGRAARASDEKTGFAGYILILFFAAVEISVFLCALCPEIFYDSQFYQLGVPNEWIQNRTMANKTSNPAHFFPFNVNMYFYLAMLINNEITAKLAHFLCGLVTAWGVFLCGTRNFSKRTGLIAALVFVSVPFAMLVSTKTSVEMGIGMFVTAMMLSLYGYFENWDRRALALAGIFCGFAAGSKYTELAFTVIPATATVAAYSFLNRKDVKKTAVDMMVFFAGLAAAAFPWYLRNIIETGNPFFPFFEGIFGGTGLKVQYVLGADPAPPKFTFINYFLFLWPLTMGTLQQEAITGPVFLLFLPFIFVFSKNMDKKIKYSLLYVSIAVLMWAKFGNFYVRYFIPTLAVVSIVVAYFIEMQKTGGFMKTLCLLLLFYVVYQNIAFSNTIIKISNDPLLYVLGIKSEKEYLSTARPSYPNPYFQVLDYANKHLPEDSKILFIGETRGLYCKRPYLINAAGESSYFIEPLKESKNADEYYRLLKEKGITHFLLNVPELKRLYVYGNLYWDRREFGVFNEFWDKYVAEVYADIADIAVPQQGILSLKAQSPQWWAGYSRDPFNYVYLYRLLSKEEAQKPHRVPFNILANRKMYSEKQQRELFP
ncbi:MAG: glycosyltransferase family 39 protein [Endomicrobiales bacterium]|nr:glycosyltransferase family 39 protein [Endomicrobiales bacterium]